MLAVARTGSHPDWSVEREGFFKARAGFEPANDGFANRCLSQLGDRATIRRMGIGLSHAGVQELARVSPPSKGTILVPRWFKNINWRIAVKEAQRSAQALAIGSISCNFLAQTWILLPLSPGIDVAMCAGDKR